MQCTLGKAVERQALKGRVPILWPDILEEIDRARSRRLWRIVEELYVSQGWRCFAKVLELEEEEGGNRLA